LTTDHNLILWEAAAGQPIAARVAVAGDFLPAGKLQFPAGANWRGMARNLGRHFDDVATTFANLECPVAVEGCAARPLSGLGQIVSAPADSLEYLAAMRSRAVGIANNHAYDFGSAGVVATRQAIARADMLPLGAGRNSKNHPEVFIWYGPGALRVGFWAAAQASGELATRDLAGVEPATALRGLQALDEMKSRGATFCIALLHAGCLRTNRPAPEDVALMTSLAKSGFDLLAASHSHRISGYARIDAARTKRSFCFNGLGSLVSGYSASPLEREGLVIVAGFNASGEFARVEVRPVLLEENGFGAVPDASAARSILARFQHLSQEIADGTYEKKFYRELSPGLVRLYLRDVRAAFRARGISGLSAKARRIRFRHVKRLVHKVTG
jgi:poly-gamma-glutamate capsule biosynthesis protein CapA/YwtB (metallophosphatase superfamily)